MGKVPGWSEKLNKFVKDPDIAGAASRIIRTDIPSGPWTFVTFKPMSYKVPVNIR